jgi:antagonist of KipI
VLHPGVLTTVQDRGRTGHQREGIPVSGAMDVLSLRIANLLVGNDENAAALEMTLVGATLRFDEQTLVAITGADVNATVDGIRIPPWRPACVAAGAVMTADAALRGCRAYLAVAGGIDVPQVLGSRATYARAALGGVDGRPLRRGDVVPCGVAGELARRIARAIVESGPAAKAIIARWGAAATLVPFFRSAAAIRVVEDAHTSLLTTESLERLWGLEFRVSTQSDRMGYRLEGPPLELARPIEMLSEAVAFGTIQCPPGGSPIILMADRQTTGGYPRIGTVASVDLPLVAQLKPGDRLRFRPVSLDEAQRLYLAREDDIAQARMAIALRHQ